MGDLYSIKPNANFYIREATDVDWIKYYEDITDNCPDNYGFIVYDTKTHEYIKAAENIENVKHWGHLAFLYVENVPEKYMDINVHADGRAYSFLRVGKNAYLRCMADKDISYLQKEGVIDKISWEE